MIIKLFLQHYILQDLELTADYTASRSHSTRWEAEGGNNAGNRVDNLLPYSLLLLLLSLLLLLLLLLFTGFSKLDAEDCNRVIIE